MTGPRPIENESGMARRKHSSQPFTDRLALYSTQSAMDIGRQGTGPKCFSGCRWGISMAVFCHSGVCPPAIYKL